MRSDCMTSEREKFFRRRLLFKLYPCEDGTETDSDASDQEEMSVKTTECNVYMNASFEGRKRMLSEEKEREQGSSQQASQVEQDKQNDVATPLRSFASVKKRSLPEAESTDQSPSAQFVTGNIGTENRPKKRRGQIPKNSPVRHTRIKQVKLDWFSRYVTQETSHVT
ncbi:uncharacterized protein LOC141894722 isoform X2 [Acropora palmata]|uniref:uncharacterized protein LOC141894722 isoform X2 n=1 Tax=Acropora palmata TaxID=6131 RepID=UPI003DA053DE